ncbi:MAG: phosphatidylglycerophosphatase A [Pseudomonadota bacterium]|nr:phosphatidylglycerophosphatase A [Pseudomonadota bacterium]
MKKFAAYLTATWFGLGFSPKASGTFGSLGALPLVWVLAFYASLPIMFAVAAVLFFAGVWATHQIIKQQENKDPSLVVIDEVVGQMLSFSLVWPYLADWKIYALGFALFRFFDICKMGPVKFFDSRVHNAWGVMLDDVFAGITAAIVLYLLCSFF